MGPSTATTKRLFAVSGNLCGFPKCSLPLVDAASGKVTGRICHIRAAQPGGPRFDPNQSEDERHGFDNLLLLCPIHHDVIDADDVAYTVERLVKMKLDAERRNAVKQELSDDAARILIETATTQVSIHGSVIVSQNQLGGQIAHSITNVGPQPRRISEIAGVELAEALSRLPADSHDITSVMGDIEAQNLAEQLDNVLKAGGWSSKGTAVGGFVRLPRGITISVSEATPARVFLLQWCQRCGFKTEGHLDPKAKSVRIIVGTVL